MEKTAKTLAKVLFGAFVFWYLSRRTSLGQAFTTDVAAIPQQLGVAEGLKSAIQFTK
jgi:hypothetical protein